MLTPLDIENKKFDRKMMNGYNVDQVDDFLDQITEDYGKLYKESIENKNKMEEIQQDVSKYKNIENTLQNTLVMAQTAADDMKSAAKKEAEQIINEAQLEAKQQVAALEQEIVAKQKELEELKKQFDVYKAKMESLLISQLELLKDVNKDD